MLQQRPYWERPRAVVDRATSMISNDTEGQPVARYQRRSLFRRRRPAESPNVPDTQLDALRRAASFVASNLVLLDAAADDPDRLDPAAEAIDRELAEATAQEALAQFEAASAQLVDRLVADPDLVVERVYRVARTSSELAVFVATELHLVARMLDPTYEPADARALAHLLNQSLRSMMGHGLEDWITERIMPWRNLAIRRPLGPEHQLP